MTIYRFTATITKRPYSQNLKGTVKVIGTTLDAFKVVSEIIRESAGLSDKDASVKITISPTSKKA